AWHLHRWARPAAIAFELLVIVFGFSVIGGSLGLGLACLVTAIAVTIGFFLPAVLDAYNRLLHDRPPHTSPRTRPGLHPRRPSCPLSSTPTPERSTPGLRTPRRGGGQSCTLAACAAMSLAGTAEKTASRMPGSSGESRWNPCPIRRDFFAMD